MSGLILFNGPSVLDGSPIVVVATKNTTNQKTGPMIQTWIIRADMAPAVAVKKGADTAICGKCPHRHFSGGGCYVQPYRLAALYKKFARGGVSNV